MKKMLLATGLSVLLAGCFQTVAPAVAPNVQAATSFCAVAYPFRWDPKDTDETIIQAKQWNAVGVDLECPRFERKRP